MEDTVLECDNIDTLLIKHDIAPTRQRRLIGEILFERHQHLSADEVLHLVKQKSKGVAKATIYNTLGLFVGKGLIREVVVDPSKLYFDTNNQPHHHFYNVITGELQDIAADQLETVHPPGLPKGTELDKVDIIFHIQPRT